MNKYKLSIVLAVLILLSSSQGAMALSLGVAKRGSTSTPQPTYQKVNQEVKDTMLQEREKLRQEMKTGSLEVMQKVGALHATTLETRFSFYYNRLKGIYDRLGARITALESQYGPDKLAKAKSLWKQAGDKLEEAKSKGSATITTFRTIEGKDLKAQRQKVFAARDNTKVVLALYKQATQLMKDAVKELRLVTNASPNPKKMPPTKEKQTPTQRTTRTPEAPVPVVPPSAN